MSDTPTGRFPAMTCPECGPEARLQPDMRGGSCANVISCAGTAETWERTDCAPPDGGSLQAYGCPKCGASFAHTFYDSPTLPVIDEETEEVKVPPIQWGMD